MEAGSELTNARKQTLSVQAPQQPRKLTVTTTEPMTMRMRAMSSSTSSGSVGLSHAWVRRGWVRRGSGMGQWGCHAAGRRRAAFHGRRAARLRRRAPHTRSPAAYRPYTQLVHWHSHNQAYSVMSAISTRTGHTMQDSD